VHLVRDALPEARHPAVLRIICVGNSWRSDDAAGLAVARQLRAAPDKRAEIVEQEGEPTALIDSLEGVDAAWIVDAVSSGAEAGTVHRLDAVEQQLPSGLFGASTHHLGIADAVELARALGKLPSRLIVYGIEGERFDAGNDLTPAVVAAVERVVESLRGEVAELASEA
jgi:hydrogenase maturation protease